jgi:hypothetical protein
VPKARDFPGLSCCRGASGSQIVGGFSDGRLCDCTGCPPLHTPGLPGLSSPKSMHGVGAAGGIRARGWLRRSPAHGPVIGMEPLRLRGRSPDPDVGPDLPHPERRSCSVRLQSRHHPPPPSRGGSSRAAVPATTEPSRSRWPTWLALGSSTPLRPATLRRSLAAAEPNATWLAPQELAVTASRLEALEDRLARGRCTRGMPSRSLFPWTMRLAQRAALTVPATTIVRCSRHCELWDRAGGRS